MLTTTKAAGAPDGLLGFFGRTLTCGLTTSDEFQFPAIASTTSEMTDRISRLFVPSTKSRVEWTSSNRQNICLTPF